MERGWVHSSVGRHRKAECSAQGTTTKSEDLGSCKVRGNRDCAPHSRRMCWALFATADARRWKHNSRLQPKSLSYAFILWPWVRATGASTFELFFSQIARPARNLGCFEMTYVKTKVSKENPGLHSCTALILVNQKRLRIGFQYDLRFPSYILIK